MYVLDALKKSIIGTVGIITATSKNCYYVAVDVDKPSSCTNGSSRSGLTNTSIATETERTNGNIELTNIKNKHGVSANTALMLVKAECILGLVLPALHAHKQQHKEHHHQQQAQPQKVSAQDTPRELFTDDSTGVDAAVVGEMNPSAVGGFKYDFNERNSGGRICVMYGKHFMPDCKFV